MKHNECIHGLQVVLVQKPYTSSFLLSFFSLVGCKESLPLFAHHTKKLKHWVLTNQKYRCASLWPTFIGYVSSTMGKNYGTKYGAIGNALGTCGEHIGNMVVGPKIYKIECHTLPVPHKGIKDGTSSLHVEPSHWLHENYIPKIVHHHFQLGLIALYKRVGTCQPHRLVPRYEKKKKKTPMWPISLLE